MKILLMGNPNVGKSAIFTRLTGVKVVTANYHGTTVEYTKGYMKLGSEQVEVIDVPGTYTLDPTCKAEEVAVKMLQEGDLVINVIDSTNLERNLSLALELMEIDIPVIIAMNMWDETKHKGISLDIEELEKFLKVPIVPTVGPTGEGIAKLVSRITEAVSPPVRKHSQLERWEDIGKIVTKVQSLKHRHHTFLEILQDASIRPLTGIPMALIIIFSMFQAVRFIGEGLINFVFDPFFENLLKPLLMQLSEALGRGTFLHELLIGKLIETTNASGVVVSSIDFFQSFGALTTGLYVPIAAVLPYIFAFYIMLGFLEDIGYLPRLAVLMDVFMHRIGLHGFTIVSMVLGLGCNVPGLMATRNLESRRERFIACTILSIGVPCAALQAMIWGLVGVKGGQYVVLIYFVLFLVWLVTGFILSKFVSGFSPELFVEIPPYRWPIFKVLAKKLWMRVYCFLKEALPIVFIGVLAANLLSILGIFEKIAAFAAPVVTGLLGLPKEAVTALIIGFLRKDLAIGMLGPLDLSIRQLVVGTTVLAMFFPCIATFVVLLRELGMKDMLKSILIMLGVSLLTGTTLNWVLLNLGIG